MIPSDFVKAPKPHVDFRPVCAEMEIGLGVPRSTIRIVSEKGEIRPMQPATGLDVTEKTRDLVANRDNLRFEEQARLYRGHLAEALKKPPRSTSKANVFMHSVLEESNLFEPFPEVLIALCRDTQCEWAGSELFEDRDNSPRPQKS